MKYKAILFDMDGTMVPMDLNAFTKGYFQLLFKKLAKHGLDPAECLMIGNDENEDMYAAAQAGLQGWLVTDWMIPSPEHPWDGPKGSFAQTAQMLEGLECWP